MGGVANQQRLLISTGMLRCAATAMGGVKNFFKNTQKYINIMPSFSHEDSDWNAQHRVELGQSHGEGEQHREGLQ